MRFLYIAMTAALAATAIAAPLPDEDLSVKGSVSASGKRDAAPKKALTVGTDGSLVIDLKRDVNSKVSAELTKLIKDLEKLLSKRDAAPEEDLTVNADGSVSANVKREPAAAASKPVKVKGSGDLNVNGKREPAAVADKPIKVGVSGDGKINVGLKRDTQSVTMDIEELIEELEDALEELL